MSSLAGAIESALQSKKAIAEKAVRKRAREIFNECVDLGEFAISQFYRAYQPNYYQRTHSFDDVFLPYMEKTTDGDMPAYYVGIRAIEGIASGHKDPDEYVFHGVVDMGVHGTSDIFVSNPPWDYVIFYFKQFD